MVLLVDVFSSARFEAFTEGWKRHVSPEIGGYGRLSDLRGNPRNVTYRLHITSEHEHLELVVGLVSTATALVCSLVVHSYCACVNSSSECESSIHNSCLRDLLSIRHHVCLRFIPLVVDCTVS